MKKEKICEFEQKGLGPLFSDLDDDNIDSEEFVKRLEHFENRPIIVLGRLARKIVMSVFPFMFHSKE
jgi:hypothetical protein